MKKWQKEYKKEKFYWGIKPYSGLEKVLNYAPIGVAIDIGAGEGRNSIFLAKNGFTVIAIDKISEGLKKLNKFSKKENLSIKTETIDIRNFNFPKKKYSLVLSIATLDFLKFSEFKNIVKKIKKSLISEGVIYFSVFSQKDPFFDKFRKMNFKMVEKNTFYLPKAKIHRHFFTKEELKEVFKDYEMILFDEKEFKDDSHGNPHIHNIIELVVKKNKK